MKPVIGVTMSINFKDKRFYVNDTYVEAVTAAGGIPVMLAPQLDEDYVYGAIDKLDGLLLSGGGDIDPAFFNEEDMDLSKNMSRKRDIMELKFVKAAAGMDMPILGICRGCQIINVAMGGSLYQDISLKKGVFNHEQNRDEPGWYPYHDIILDEGSKIYGILGQRTISVNSLHHQAIKQPGEGIKITASSRDGVAEVIEDTVHTFILGVQFHPEKMFGKDTRFLPIFDALITASSKGEVYNV